MFYEKGIFSLITCIRRYSHNNTGLFITDWKEIHRETVQL